MWRDWIAMPSRAFLGPLSLPVGPTESSAADRNAFLSSVLVSGAWPSSQPLAGLHRLQQPVHDRRAMWQLMEERCRNHAGTPGRGPSSWWRSST